MMIASRLWAAALVVVVLAPAAMALEVTRRAGPVGDVATLLQPRDGPATIWEPAILPATTLAPRVLESVTTDTGDQSSFRLQDVQSDLRPRTQSLLTEFGAREEDGKILIALPGDVLFDFDKSDVRANAKPVLNRLAELLTAYADAPVTIAGHTDAKGSDDYNLALSQRRAASVRDYLGGEDVDIARMSITGLGEHDPVAPNTQADGSDDPAGRQRNRRVEFTIGRAPG